MCAGIRFSDAARSLIRAEMEPLEFVRLLQERALYSDAIPVVARLFPKREAVWWACQCTRQSLMKSELPKAENDAVGATEAWVADSSEETRRPLFAAAQTAGLDTSAGCAAMAAFGSGGSMVPPEYEPVEPDDSMTAQLVSGSILMAGVAEDPDAALVKYRVFLEQGLMLYEQSSEQPSRHSLSE